MIDQSKDLAALVNEATLGGSEGNLQALLSSARSQEGDFPQGPEAYRAEARALTEAGDAEAADRVLMAGLQLYPYYVELCIDFAKNAARLGDRAAALQRWELMRQRLPEQARAALGVAESYRALGRPHEADQVLTEAVARFPNNLMVLSKWADSAVAQADWRRAIERLQVLRDRFPDKLRGYTGAINALRALNRVDEADEITEAGLARHPADVTLREAHARNAMRRENYVQAETRWRALLALHPKVGAGYVGLATMFCRQQRFAECEAILLRGMRMRPDVAKLVELHAEAAVQRGDWAEAADRWQVYVQRFPHRGEGYHQRGIALKKLGRMAEAEQTFASGMALAPDHLPVALEHAWCASSSHDRAEALRRWEALSLRFPQALEVKEGYLNARLAASESGILSASGGMPASGADGPAPDAAAAARPEEILAQFESLGENCEFGLVQRQFGLEPISLFRWVSITMVGLTRALEDGLKDIGNREHTRLVLRPPATEFHVADSFYRFGMHTFVRKDSVDEARFYEQQRKRLIFLARKLLEDLQAGERIFVHFRAAKSSRPELLRLHQAIRRHGNATLLVVQLSDAQHRPGTVEVAKEGLMIGYIDRFGKKPPADWDIAFDTWLKICRNALDLRRKLAALGQDAQ